MAEKLEPGWYWVKYLPEMPWEAARFTADWSYAGAAVIHDRPALIGPRIEPPADSGEAGRG